MTQQPSKRQVISYLMRVFPQGNPFHDVMECVKCVDANFGVQNINNLKAFLYRCSAKFKGCKGKREVFWKMVEKSDNLAKPLEDGN